MSSTYNLRPTSYIGAHLDRELALRGAHTSGTTERKQERLQRFVEAQQTATPKSENTHKKIVEEIRRAIVAPPRRSSRIAEAELPEVRRSSRIAALLNEYLGY